MTFAKPSINPMEFAKKAGALANLEEAFQRYQVSMKEMPEKIEKYGQTKGAIDLGSNVISSALLALFTGGTSLATAPFGQKVASSILKPLAKKGMGDFISEKLGTVFGVKPPKMPKLDTSQLTGPYQQRGVQTIMDRMKLDETSLTQSLKGVESGGDILSSLMAISPELKSPIWGGKEAVEGWKLKDITDPLKGPVRHTITPAKDPISIMDYLKKILDVDLMPDVNLGNRFLRNDE